MEMFCIPPSNDLAFITKLIKEQKPTKSIDPHELRERNKWQRSDTTQRQLNKAIIGPSMPIITIAASEVEMRKARDDEGEDDEDEPRERSSPTIRLIDTHPPEPWSETLEFIGSVRGAASESSPFCCEKSYPSVIHGHRDRRNEDVGDSRVGLWMIELISIILYRWRETF